MTFFLSMKSNSIRVWKQKDELFAILQMNIFITKYMTFMLSKGLVVSGQYESNDLPRPRRSALSDSVN